MQLQWQNVTPMYTTSSTNKQTYPNQRWGHSGCTLKDPYIFLFGGYSDSKYFNDTWVYNWTTSQWINFQTDGGNGTTCPDPRSNSTIVYDHVKDRIVLFGGGSASNVRHNDVWVMEMKEFYECEKVQAERQRQRNGSSSLSSLSSKPNKNLHKYKPKWQIMSQQDQHNHISQESLWPRTYHAGILIQNHLFIHGGQGYGSDLDDLWCFNLNTKKWKQLKTTNTPKGRRFHTGINIDNYLYIIGGCHDGYNCLNDIHRIDLTKFIKKQKELALLEQNFSYLNGVGQQDSYKYPWQAVNVIDKGIFMARWGHMSCAIDRNIYIYGGRSYNDHSDVLVLETSPSSSSSCGRYKSQSSSSSVRSINSLKLMGSNKQNENPMNINGQSSSDDEISPYTEPMRMSTVRNIKTPKGRRRACMWVVGSCILLHGGFNGNYFEDMHFLNVHQTIPLKFDKLQLNQELFVNLENEKKKPIHQNQENNNNIKTYPYDIHIYTSDHKILHLRTKDIRHAFLQQHQMVEFIQALAQYTYEQALQYSKILHTGVYDQSKLSLYPKINKDILSKYGIITGGCLLSAAQRRFLFTGNIKEDIIMMNSNPLKGLKVSRPEIQRIFGKMQEDRFNDVTLHFQESFEAQYNSNNKPDSLSSNTTTFKSPRPFKANSHTLSLRSVYFQSCLQSSSFYRKQPISLTTSPSAQKAGKSKDETIFHYKLLMIYLHYGHLVIPHCFTLDQLLACYELAEMYLIEGARRILLFEIMSYIHQVQEENALERFKSDLQNFQSGCSSSQNNCHMAVGNGNGNGNCRKNSKYYPGYMESIVEFCLKGGDWQNLHKVLEMAVGKIIIDASKHTANTGKKVTENRDKKEEKESSTIFSLANISAVLCMGRKPSQSTTSSSSKQPGNLKNHRKIMKTPNSLKNLNLRKNNSQGNKNSIAGRFNSITLSNSPSLHQLENAQKERQNISQEDNFFNPYQFQRRQPSEADFQFQLELENVMEMLDMLQNKYDGNSYSQKYQYGSKRKSSIGGEGQVLGKKNGCENVSTGSSIKSLRNEGLSSSSSKSFRCEKGSLGQVVSSVKDMYKLEIAYWRSAH